LVIAALSKCVLRARLGCLRGVDIAALWSPVVPLGAVIGGSAAIFAEVCRYWGMVSAAFIGQGVVLLLLLWLTSRRVLSLSRLGTVGVLVLGVLLVPACAVAGFCTVRWLIPPPQIFPSVSG